MQDWVPWAVAGGYAAVDMVVFFWARASIAKGLDEWDEYCRGQKMTLPRQEMFERLESRLLDDPAYTFLQRMTLMAPLLGVLITTFGFATLNYGQIDWQDPKAMLGAIRPLFWGVFVGAALAFVHQFVLQAVARTNRTCLAEGETRLSAFGEDQVENSLGGFSNQIAQYSQKFAEQQEAILATGRDSLSGVGTQMEQLVETVKEVVENCRGGGGSLAAAADQFEHELNRTAMVFRDELGKLNNTVTESTQEFEQSIARTHADFGSQMRNLGDTLSPLVTELSTNLSSDQQRLDAAFTGLAETHKRYDGMLSGLYSMAQDANQRSIETRDVVAEQVGGATQILTTSVKSIDSLAGEMAGIQRAVLRDEQARNQSMMESVQAAQAFAKNMKDTSDRMGNAAIAFQSATEGMLSVVTELRGHLDHVNHDVRTLNALVQQAGQHAKTLRKNTNQKPMAAFIRRCKEKVSKMVASARGRMENQE